MAGRDGSPGPLRYRLWCGGLYKDITEDEIRQRVEPFADVIKVMLRSSVKDTFCFIQFRSQKDMDIAREKLDQSNLLGDRVCAQPATADKKKDGGPPARESRGPPKAEGMGKGGGKDKGSDYGRRPRSRTPAGHDDRHGGKGNQKPRYQEGPRGPHAGEGRSDRRRDDGPGMPRPDSREARRPDPQWELRDAGGRGPRGDRREERGREDYRVEDFRKESFRREDFRRDDFRRDDFRREDFPRDDRRDDPRREEPRRRDDYRRDEFRQEAFRRPPPGREEPPREHPRRDDRRDDFRREDHRRGAAAPRREEPRAPDPRGPDPRRDDYRRDGPRREERPEREREPRERSHRDFREPRADFPAPRGDRGDRAGDRGGYRYDDQRRGDERRAGGHEYQGRATRDPPREPPRDANPPREYDSGPGSFRKVREVYESKVPLGRHKITVENLPEDMTWVEFKDLGKDFGSSITFARTFQVNGVNRGMLEYQDRADADNAIRELDDRRVEGSNLRLRAYYAPEGRGS